MKELFALCGDLERIGAIRCKAGETIVFLDHRFYTDRVKVQQPLTEDLKAASGEPRLLFRASDATWTKEMEHSSGIRGRVTDGPFLWRDEKERLLCLWSSFSENGYTQGLAESDNGEITGNFRQLPPLFREDGGHGMLFRDKEGQTVLTLHRPNRHLEEHPVFIRLPSFPPSCCPGR